MALRADEEFVRDSLVKYLGGQYYVKSWEGEDPPDIYIEIEEDIKAVEITRLSPVSFNQDGYVQNRNTQDSFGINLCNELDSKLKTDVPSQVDLILTLYVPVDNARKYRRELHAYLKDFIAYGIKPGDRSEIKITGEKVKISVVPNRDFSQKKIVGIIVNKNSSAHILSNAEFILAGRIKDKVEKCKKIQHEGSIWLALFNDYLLADHDTYAQAIKNIQVQHEFKKIFVVFDTGIVHQIY